VNVSTAWSTPIAAVIAMATGGVALAIAAVTVGADAAGRVILGLAAVVMLGFALLAGLRRPRLALIHNTAGLPRLAVRGLRGVTTYSTAEITRVRLTSSRRIGRSNAMLEIDLSPTGPNPTGPRAAPGRAEDRLLVFSRWDLGATPRTVLDVLTEAGLVR
jgi:hypothetical protein